MKDLEKIKEFFLKDRAMTAAYEAKEEYFKPLLHKDKSNPNFLYIDITYPAGSDVLSVGGSKTMGGQDREEGAAKALAMGNMIAKKLQAKYNIEDIDVSDLKNGKVEVFAVSDDFIKMASPSLDEAKSEDKVDTITMDIPLFIRMLEYSREDAKKDLDLHDVTEKANALGKEKGILSMEDYDAIVGAAEEIQEVNLKVSKLSTAEYQKAKKLKDFKASDWKYDSKEDLYTKVNEGMGGQLDEPYFIEVSVRDARKALNIFDDQYRKANIKMYGSNVYAADTPEDIYDLYYDLTSQDIEVLDYNVDGDLDEATDYMKRRKAMDDYAVSKKDKPAKSYNPTPSGKTDYMKRREAEKGLEEKITEALNKINEELCPAGKAYIKRRQAAGEKSSAYLSGRAVKVCKGQMSGKAKKK